MQEVTVRRESRAKTAVTVAARANAAHDQEMEAASTVADLTYRNLSSIYSDLLARLEGSVVTDRGRFIDDYISTMVKRDEMRTLWTDPAFYQHLKEAILHEFLPIYDRYGALREQAEKKLERNTWPRYCLGTIGVCLVIEMFATEGRVVRPQMLMPAVLVDGLLGYGIWYLANFRALRALRRLNRNLLNSIRDLVEKQQVSDKYEVFRTYTGGDLLKAELQQLLASYGSPVEFWRDYERVRRADPTTPEDLRQLGIQRFNGFLELHLGGTYSEEARRQRFDALFLLAHKAFILADRKDYVLDNLAVKNP